MGARVYIPILGRFISVDPIEGGTDNNYAYVNDPVNSFDLGGNALETVADIASVGYDAYQMYKKPSWGNAGMLSWSVAAVFVPFVPGSYAGKAAMAGVKAAKSTPPRMVKKAVQVIAAKKIATVNRIANSQRFGTTSKLFGNNKFANPAGYRKLAPGRLNTPGRNIKVGWSNHGVNYVFRIGIGKKKPGSNISKYHINLFKGGRIRGW